MFIEQLEEFISSQKRHLELEEQSVLPLISRTFNVADWQVVEASWQQSEDDPVFGETIAEQYQQLAHRVRQTAQESQ